MSRPRKLCFRNMLPLVAVLLFLMEPSAFSQKPEIYIQTGHSLSVETAAFSPDGKILASGSYDLTIKLWDVDPIRNLRL